MGYKMPIVCKDLYLPISRDMVDISLDEYKDIFGVDLSKYIFIENKQINFVYPDNCKVYIVCNDVMNLIKVIEPNIYEATNYEAGSTDGLYYIGKAFLETGGLWATSYGFLLRLNKDSDPVKENILVSYFEN